MKRLKLIRSNDYASAILPIVVRINGEQHKLYLGSTLNLELDAEEEIIVEIRYLIFWRKYVYKTSASDLKITIAPTISNKIFGFGLLILFSLLFLFIIFDDEFLRFVFRLYAITLLVMFYFIGTIGGKFFYSATLKE